MANEIVQFDYRYIVLDDDPSIAAATVSGLWESGVTLVGYSEFPHSPGRSQVNLIAEDTESLTETAEKMGLQLSSKKTGFLIRGENRPGAAVADILNRLAEANIGVTSLHAVSAGAGRFGALLWVKPPDVTAAAKVLRAAVYLPETIDETSAEELPAAEAPTWAVGRPA